MASDGLADVLQQQQLQGAILELVMQIAPEPGGGTLDPYLFRLPTWCSENIPQPSGIIALMKVCLATLQRITLTGKSPRRQNYPEHGQANNKHTDMLHSAQDHGGDPQLSRTDERKCQREQNYDDQNQRKQSRRMHIAADWNFRQKSGRHLKSAQQIEQQPVSFANQCWNVLVESLREKAAAEDDAFFFAHKNSFLAHNRFSTLFFSIKMAESQKTVLVSCTIQRYTCLIKTV